MKKITNLLLSLFALTIVGCASNNNSNNDSQSTVEESSSQVEVKEITFVNLPASDLSAELGEKCDIPEVSAKRGEKELDVSVAVKDVNNNDVEVIGRGTRFIADSVDGYKIIYTAKDEIGSKSAEIKVNVSDTVGPEVKFNQDVNNICVVKGSMVTIPTPTWEDNSGTVKESSFKVTYNDQEVNVENNQFVASEYGIYNIEYTASDKNNNTTTKIVSVDCARMITLNDFNDLSSIWANKDISELTPDHAIEGNSFKVTGNGEWNAIAVYPVYYDLSGFDRLQLSIYATKDIDTGDEGFYLLNQRYTLSEGLNVVTITKDEFASQYENGKIPSSNPKYYDRQYIWFQLKSDGGSIYLDNFVGIFDNYTTDTKSPTIDFGKAIAHDKTTVLEKSKLIVPEATAYDNSMEDITITHTVFNKNGDDITSLVDSGSYSAIKDEEYRIVYSATDSSNNTASKTLTITVDPKAIIPDLDKDLYFPSDRKYDMLNDFENTGVDWCVVDKEFVNEHVMNGDVALRLSTTKADQCVVLKLLKNGNVLSTSDFEKYEKIQVYVYSDAPGARFDFYGRMFTLEEGPNVITITPQEILAEIAKASNVYDSTGGFYFQATTGTMYVDAIIGIYPEGYKEEEPKPIEKPDSIVNYYPTDRKYDVLQDFEAAGSVDTWFFSESEGLSDKYSVNSKSFHVTGDGNYAKLPIIMLKNGQALTKDDWGKYESFKIAIYSETSGVMFGFLNKLYTLEKGYNVITISKEDMLAQLNTREDCYAKNYFWCTLHGTNLSIYIDEMMGIYPEIYQEEVEDTRPDYIKNYYPTDRNYDILQDFETANSVDTWFFKDSEGLSDKYYVNGKSFHVTGTGNYVKLPIIMLKNGQTLTMEDWSKYESFKIAIYSETSGVVFCFLNKIYTLEEGYNVITISKEDMLAQLNSNSECYVKNYFWCQVNGTDVSLYIDEMIGIYPEEVEDTRPDAIKNYYPTDRNYDILQDFETANSVDTWFFKDSEGLSDKYYVNGKSFHVTGTGNYAKLPIIMLKNGQALTMEDWSKYESFKIAIYSETSGVVFCFLSKIYTLEEDYNVITISKEDMLAQLNSNPECYVNNYFWCQVNGTDVSLYIDEMIGIYPEN